MCRRRKGRDKVAATDGSSDSFATRSRYVNASGSIRNMSLPCTPQDKFLSVMEPWGVRDELFAHLAQVVLDPGGSQERRWARA